MSRFLLSYDLALVPPASEFRRACVYYYTASRNTKIKGRGRDIVAVLTAVVRGEGG
jgi:hypothetical protein